MTNNLSGADMAFLITACAGMVIWTSGMVYIISTGIKDWWTYRKKERT